MRDRGVNGRASPCPCPDDDDVTEARASREGLPLLVTGLTEEDVDDDGAVADTVSSTNFPPLMLWLLSG